MRMMINFGGSFWNSFKGFQTSQAFEELLNNPDTTLFDVLEDEDVIQELKNQNQKLIGFLDKSRIAEMIDLITVLPPPDADQKRGYKFPFVVCELLSCEVPSVIDNFFTQSELLTRFFKFLDEEELNYTLSGYFSKVCAVLINRNGSEMLKFIFESGYSSSLLKHVYIMSISEILLKTLYVSETSSELYPTERIRLFTQVISKMLTSDNSDSTFNCANICFEILNKGLENKIITEYVKHLMQRNTLDRIFDKIFIEQDPSRDSCLFYLKSLLNNPSLPEFMKLKSEYTEKTTESSNVEEDSNVCMGQEDLEQQEGLITCILQNMPKIQNSLKIPLNETIPSTFGEKIQVLSKYKLDLVELLNSIIRLNNREILLQLASSNIVEIVVDLFFTYTWNSLLHNLFENIVMNILNTDCIELHTSLLSNTSLLYKLVSTGLNPTHQTSKGLVLRLGCMGNITRIANNILKLSKSQTHIKDCLTRTSEWEDFTERYLNPQNAKDSKNLGGYKPNTSIDSMEDIEIPLDSAAQYNIDYSKFQSSIPANEEFEELEEELDSGNFKPMTRDELEGFFDLSEKPKKEIPGIDQSVKSTTPNIVSRSLDVLGKLLEQDIDFKDKKQSLKELCKSTSSMSYTYEDPTLLVYNANVFWKSQIPLEDLEDLE